MVILKGEKSITKYYYLLTVSASNDTWRAIGVVHMEEKTTPFFHLQYSEETTADLRGRQSVRTTFKLSERSIGALSILAGQLGIKQKSLFDHLIEDTPALRMIASEFVNVVGQATQRVAKTYVISRKTLENLERVSEQYNTPRDALVEYSIERILPLLVREKEKHIKRKILMEELREYLHQGTAILARAENDLGRDDPVYLEIFTMIRSVNTCCRGLEQCVVRGNKIENF